MSETYRVWYLSTIANSESPYSGPLFSSALYLASSIVVTFTNLVGSLQNQSDTNGWAVLDANGPRTIESSSGTDNTVTLVVDQPLEGPVYVYFCPNYWCPGGIPTLADTGPPPLTPEPFAGEQAYPWWNPTGDASAVAAYQGKGAASYAASKINLVTPGTHDITDPTPPTWTTGAGWGFTGSQYLNANLSMADLGKLNAVGIVRYKPEAAPYNANKALFGMAYTTEASGYETCEIAIYHNIFENWYWIFGQYNLNGVFQGGTPAYSDATLCLDGGDCYIDNVYEGTCSPVLTWIDDGNTDIYIGAIHNYVEYLVGPPDDWDGYGWRGNIIAAAFYDTSLTTAQRTAIFAAMEMI